MHNRSLIVGGAVAVVAVVLAIVSYSAFSSSSTASDAPDVVALHRGNLAEPATLDPHKAAGTWESRIVNDMFEGLYTLAADGTPILGLAEDHDMSADGLTHRFTIREGLTWSDGTPLTAHDFEYSFRRAVDPNTAADFASFFYIIENARAINNGEIDDLTQLGARAVDEHTFEISLLRPDPNLPDRLTGYPFFAVPRHAVEAGGDQWTRPGNMVASGPYIVANWVPNDYIRAVRNPRYYDNDNVQIDEVYYYPTDDASAALRRFRAGEIDLNVDYPEQQAAWLQEHMPEETRTDSSVCVGYISMNTQQPPFDDVRVRQALAMSINREMLVERVLGLGEQPAYSIVTPFAPGYPLPQPEWASIDFAERQERAQELLAEAGFDPSNPLSFVYRYRESIKNRRAAIAVARMWEDIGVDANLVNTEVVVHYNDLRTGNFAVGDAGWCPFVVAPEELLQLAHTDIAEYNYANYYSAEFEQIFDEALTLSDPVTRNQRMAEAEAIMLRDMPMIPTYYYVNKNLVGPQVQGWVDNPRNVHLTRWLSVDEDLRPEQIGFMDRVLRWLN